MDDVNVVLLGETGVGKTTFINALGNYLLHGSLADAVGNVVQLVPTTFQITDAATDRSVVVRSGTHDNEDGHVGHSGTRNPLVHPFTYEGRRVNVIDTPGMGDGRGVLYDRANTGKLLSFLERFDHLNAICVLLRPNDSRLTALFRYCIGNILSQLNRQIRDNIVFLFTNSRTTFYGAGATVPILRSTLDDIRSSGTAIPFGSENTFFTDNEAFRYLAAGANGVQFGAADVAEYERSWVKSSAACKRLLDRVLALRQSPTQIIVELRNTKVAVAKLAGPLVEIMLLHEKSISQMKARAEDIERHRNSIEDLKPRLNVRHCEYRVMKTVTTDTKSGHEVKLGGSLIATLFGMDASVYHTDMTVTHVEEVPLLYETTVEDANVRAMLDAEATRLRLVAERLKELKEAQNEYAEESKVIVTAAAKFVAFVKKNAIFFPGDPFQKHLEDELLEEERSDGSPTYIGALTDLLLRYKLRKRALSADDVTESDISAAITQLLRLKHAGAPFRQLYNEILD